MSENGLRRGLIAGLPFAIIAWLILIILWKIL